MLEKHDERLNELITFGGKDSLQFSSLSLSDLSLFSRNENISDNLIEPNEENNTLN